MRQATAIQPHRVTIEMFKIVCCKLVHFGSGLRPGDTAVKIKPRPRASLDESFASGLPVLVPGTA